MKVENEYDLQTICFVPIKCSDLHTNSFMVWEITLFMEHTFAFFETNEGRVLVT